MVCVCVGGGEVLGNLQEPWGDSNYGKGSHYLDLHAKG